MAEGASPVVANDKNYMPLDSASFGEKHNVMDFFLGQMGKAAGGLEVSGGGGADGEDGEEEIVMKAGVTEDATGGSAS